MAQGNVEIWLGKLLNMSLRSVHCVIRNAVIAIGDPNFELLDFLNSYPAQVSQNLDGRNIFYWKMERKLIHLRERREMVENMVTIPLHYRYVTSLSRLSPLPLTHPLPPPPPPPPLPLSPSSLTPSPSPYLILWNPMSTRCIISRLVY